MIRILSRIAIAAIAVVIVLVLAMREGLIPARFAPLPQISLNQPPGALVDWQLASLRHDAHSCRVLMDSPDLIASLTGDAEFRDGCGVVNSVRIERIAGTRFSVGRVRCEMATALALWMKHDVQPLATTMLGQRVQQVQHLGDYACRNIVSSNPLLKGVRSEHAAGGAIDISGFVLDNGKTISVARLWTGDSPESRFLRQIHARACRTFRAVLGPGDAAEQRNHIHLDRGPLRACQ